MTHLFKLKILSGIALAITLTNTASANTIEKLSQNVKCQACTQTDLSGKPIYKNLQKQVFSGGNGDGYQGGKAKQHLPVRRSYPKQVSRLMRTGLELTA